MSLSHHFVKEEYEMVTRMPIVTVATADDSPDTGRVWVLIINEIGRAHV